MQKVKEILDSVLHKIEPSREELEEMKFLLKEFLSKLKKNLGKSEIEVFVGGSFAKGTLVKKENYDADIFLRFEGKKYGKEISDFTMKALKNFKDVLKIHGSRDYFRVKITPSFFVELIPVKKVSNAKDADNITDLSYSHVKYINKKIKSDKILEEIKIAKAFCHAKGCYGAESYIHGFSGYSLELLIYYYGSFLKFIKEISKIKKGEKLVIDPEKHFRNKKSVLMDVNSAKLESPIVLIDPTFKYRNALAALSEETLYDFQKECKKFLRNPSEKHFERKVKDLNKIKINSVKNNNQFIQLEIHTKKQEGDIAGSKLLKFYKHLNSELKKFYSVKNKGFSYSGGKSCKCFFVGKSKNEIILEGPPKENKKNLIRFRKKHKHVFEKKGKFFAKEKINFSLEEFIKKWKLKNKKKIKEMSISKINILNF